MFEHENENQRTESNSAQSNETVNTESAPPAAAEPTPQWEDLGLSSESVELCRKAGFTAPTPIQAQSIPIALKGNDLICSSQTGSGKTASFALPMIDKFAGREGTFGIILAPTREIAQQIQQTFEIFGKPRGVRSIVLIGGIDMRLDAQAINTYPQIIVATPGRLCDHLDRGNLWLDFIQMVVLDEADRMLDMGFSDQLSRIMQEVPKMRQTLLYSATIPASVDNLARRILQDPQKVTIGKPMGAAKSIEQKLVWIHEDNRNSALRKLLRDEPGTTIVFTRSKDTATRVFRTLHSNGFYDVTYIHSDRLQSHREQALAEFKEGKYRILIATDVAARGIHVDAVAHVINYELPMEPEDYVHRIGRTGRAGAVGKATSIVTRRDAGMVKRIEKILGKPIPDGTPPEQKLEGAPVGEGASQGSGGERSERSDRGGRRGGRGRRGRGGEGGERSAQAPQGQQQQRSQGQSPRPQQTNKPKHQQNPQPIRAFQDSLTSAPEQESAGPSGGEEQRAAGPSQGPDGQPDSGAKKRRRGRRGGRGRRRPEGDGGSKSDAGGSEGSDNRSPSSGHKPLFPVD